VSGYYEWRMREPSANAREDGELARRIHHIFHEHRQVYGSPRVHAELRAQGVHCSKQRVARLMREMELAAKRHRHKPVGTTRTRAAPVAPNLLNREFEAEAPNSKWVSDTTFVWTTEGWLYVAVILDLFSRLVVGWAMSPHNDEQLVRQALEMALARRCPPKERLCCKNAGGMVNSAAFKKSRGVPFMNQQSPFKWRHFEAEIILLCVRWYLRYSLSYRDLEEMMAERGLAVDHSTIYRWVQRYAPELEQRSRPHLKATNDSWRVDETSIKIKGTWMYLYRAVDSDGNTLEFLLSPTRDAEAAKCFFVKALHAPTGSAPHIHPIEEPVEEPTAADPNTTPLAPRVINVEKNAAYPKAIADLKALGALPQAVELRQVKYLNNIVEQDHRFIKRRVKPGLGFFSFETAWYTLQGYEVMNMVRKGQMRAVEKGDIMGQVAFMANLFGVAV
jgi:IS6 family transposase